MKNISKVLFMGSKQLGLRVLQKIWALSPETLIGVITIDDTNDSRSRFNQIQKFTKKAKLKLHIANSRQHSETIIKAFAPDLCLVVGWYWLISKPTLDSVPFGFIGLHNSLLPKYRGSSPLVWSIIKGDSEVGFSVFSFTPGIDDGPIWAQDCITVDEFDDISSILKKLEEKTIYIFNNIYISILDDSIIPIEQNHENATYCAPRAPNDGFINWNQPALAIFNFIRAQSDPYPGAFTIYKNERLNVYKAMFIDATYIGTPGQVARISEDGVYIICGDDKAVLLKEVGFEGKRGNASRFINSVKIRFPRSISNLS